MNLSSLLTEAKSAAGRFIPGAAPPPVPFPASEPGGFSAPGIYLVVLFCLVLAAIWIAGGLFGLPSAQWFVEHGQLGAAAVLGTLIVPLLSYRSYNKHVAADVAKAAIAAGDPKS